MRSAKILFKDEEAGELTQNDDGSFTFQYNSLWMENGGKPSISLTLPKSQETYNSAFLFPFFYNMLPEGSNKQITCKHNKIDPDDYFGLLMITAKTDTVGAIRVVKIVE
jgi:HipA-like protein